MAIIIPTFLLEDRSSKIHGKKTRQYIASIADLNNHHRTLTFLPSPPPPFVLVPRGFPSIVDHQSRTMYWFPSPAERRRPFETGMERACVDQGQGKTKTHQTPDPHQQRSAEAPLPTKTQLTPLVPWSVPGYFSSPNHTPPWAWHSSFNIYQHHLLVLRLTPIFLFTTLNQLHLDLDCSASSVRLLVSYLNNTLTSYSIYTNIFSSELSSSFIVTGPLSVNILCISNYEHCCPPL